MNHLDPLHRLTVLGHLARLTRGGKSVIASLHDPALASHFADSILLLFGDGEWECGEASAMLSADNMERLYGTPFAPFAGDGRSVLLPVA
jgi:iron complex transport system ATP-binding protein